MFLASPSPDSCFLAFTTFFYVLLVISETRPTLGAGQGGHLAALRQAVRASVMIFPELLGSGRSPQLSDCLDRSSTDKPC